MGATQVAPIIVHTARSGHGPHEGKWQMKAIRTKFNTIRSALAAVYVEREDALEAVMLAALTHQHCLLVGPPGTGKSALFTGFLASFTDARSFVTLVTKYGTEDEYFGPVKLSALKLDKWERNLDGRLAAVECAFLDEIFKGSDSVLNTLLTVLNERTYKGASVPLRFVVGASNELPEDDGLAAVYDRFLVRDVVDYVSADATWMGLLATPPKYTPTVSLTTAEWDAAVVDVMASVKLPQRVIAEMLRVKTELKQNGIVVSDRRWIAATRVLRAAAWLDDEPEVSLDHLQALRFVLWQKPEDRPRVRAVLDTIDRSAISKAVVIIDDALRAYAQRPTNTADYMGALPRIASELTDAGKRVQAMLASGVTKRAHARIAPKLAELTAVHATLKSDLAKRYSL